MDKSEIKKKEMKKICLSVEIPDEITDDSKTDEGQRSPTAKRDEAQQ